MLLTIAFRRCCLVSAICLALLCGQRAEAKAFEVVSLVQTIVAPTDKLAAPRRHINGTSAATKKHTQTRKKKRHTVLVHQCGKNRADSENTFGEYMRSWNIDGLDIRFYSDDDMEGIVKEVVPQLAEKWSQFDTVIERVDFFRYAILYRDGGVYADLDQELLNATLLRRLAGTERLFLPMEFQDMIGQSLMMSPPKHSFWMELMNHVADKYDPTCYEVDNTGPDAVTAFWTSSGGCQKWGSKKVSLLRNMVLRRTGDEDPNFAVTSHHEAGTWRDWNSAKRSRRDSEDYPCTIGRIGAPEMLDCVSDLTDCPQLYRAVLLESTSMGNDKAPSLC